VRPLPGHAILNLGEALIQFTAGLLKSNAHRVILLHGEDVEKTRYSLVYSARSAVDILSRMLDRSKIPHLETDDEGVEIRCIGWIVRRALSYRIAL
jgi:isopenicillin N synthase-like dioxygenase